MRRLQQAGTPRRYRKRGARRLSLSASLSAPLSAPLSTPMAAALALLAWPAPAANDVADTVRRPAAAPTISVSIGYRELAEIAALARQTATARWTKLAQLVPPVARERPTTPPELDPAKTPQSEPAPKTQAQPVPSDQSPIGRMQDWLSRANREFQGTVVKELSVPSSGNDDAIARKLQETKEEEARAEAARQQQAQKDAQRKAAAEAEAARKADSEKAAAAARKRAEDMDRAVEKAPVPPSPPADNLADEMRRQRESLDAEAKRLEAEQKAAAAKAEEDKAAAQKAAEERAAQEAAAEAARLAEERAEAQRKAEAEARAEDERRRAEAAAAPPEPNVERRSIVLSTEPIARVPAVARPGARERVAYGRTQYRRGPAVARWVRRAQRCRAAGRRIKPPGVYFVAHGDNLWHISKRHYRIGRLYRLIWRANRRIIRDPDLIYPCQRLFVPRRPR